MASYKTSPASVVIIAGVKLSTACIAPFTFNWRGVTPVRFALSVIVPRRRLYGMKVIKGEPQVGAVELGKAARQSGINLARFTDALGRLAQFVQKGGQRRSTRYVLNNRGSARAEEILRAMMAGDGAGNSDG